MRVLFSVLKYNLITDESINIGIMFHNLSTDERRLETITNWRRLQNFDDELEVSMLKVIVNGIKNEILNLKEHFDIKQYHIKYVNELRFSSVREAKVDDFEKFVELIRKNYLRYDYDKKVRPNKQQQVKIMKDLMKANSIKYSSQFVIGEYNEKVSYDYTIGNYGFKIFSFEDKDIPKLMTSAKAWAYTAEEMKGKYETVFLYDKDIENKHFDTIMTILKKTGCKIIKVDEGMDYVINVFESLDKNENQTVNLA